MTRSVRCIRLTLDECIARRAPDFAVETPKPEHGRHERRSIWASCELNDYVNFPGVAQVFAVRRDTVEVKSGKRRCETAYGVTSLTPQAASPQRLLTLNRGHWTIDATHHILDWSFDEDRSRIRTGHGPENMTRLRRFAIGLIKGRGLGVAETMRNLARETTPRPRLPEDGREHQPAHSAWLSAPSGRLRLQPSEPEGRPVMPGSRRNRRSRSRRSPSQRTMAINPPARVRNGADNTRGSCLSSPDWRRKIRTNLPWGWCWQQIELSGCSL